MGIKSDDHRYGTIPIAIHWLTAALILIQFATGFRASQMDSSAAKADLLWFHAPMGNAVLVLTLIRLIWWWRFDTRPKPIGNDPRWQETTAKIVHGLFYAIIIVMAASGIAMIAMTGADAIIFDGHDAVLPNFHDYAPRTPHGLGARLMMGLLVLHIGAALLHHFVRRDATLRRMWFGS